MLPTTGSPLNEEGEHLACAGASVALGRDEKAKQRLATWTIARAARLAETDTASYAGWQMFEVAECVTIRRSAEVISPAVIDKLPSVDDFHTLSRFGKEIVAVSAMPGCRRTDDHCPSVAEDPRPGRPARSSPWGLDASVET